jgi:putative copper resistance protein D
LIDPLILVRGVHFAATLLAAGTVSFIVLVAGPSMLRRLTIVVWTALVLTVLTGLAWLALIASAILDVPVADIGRDGGLWTVVTETRFGQIACLRLALAVALAVLMGWPRQRVLQLATAAALAGLLAVVGHAGATPGAIGWVHLASDVVHVLAAAAWLGGLPALALMLASATPNASAATRRFSILGMVSVAALLASGLINSWQLLGGPGDLLAAAYGQVLLAKIILFAAMVGVAAVNRIWLTPRLPAARRALLRNSLIETGFGFAVLLLAGALGTMVPSAHMITKLAAPSSEAAFVHIHAEQVMADVTIAPVGGKSVATIRLSRENFSPYTSSYVKLVIAPRDGSLPAAEKTATRHADGNWLIDDLDIPRAGIWEIRLTIGDGGTLPVVLEAPIVITHCSNECW